MKIESRSVGDINVLDCSGKITLGEETMAVRNTVGNILKSGGEKTVLNLPMSTISTVRVSVSW